MEKVLLAISIPVLILGALMWMLHQLTVAWKRRKVDFPVGCGELTETLLKKHGLDYRIIHDSSTVGRCDWSRRTIWLGYGEKESHLAAVFQAAHEVGHAVHGPPLFGKVVRLFWGAYFAWLLACLWSGFTHNETGWLLVPMALLFGVWTLDSWVDELRATWYARRELEGLTADRAAKTALQVHFFAYCLVSIALPVSFSVALLSTGELFRRFGALMGVS
ncbi:hypothetical protein EDD75_0378 [Thermodesulfitimonas autotrophica]|uniref:Uncharacterized protein n=1 Tax=Thermodesulfitimonas autotrophica TaxID=1894989 RepID=A0A3N5C084_9THEO|nr:hypothetical protein [Thermodesulfitimonas autotrophica]RPF49561.1 hypothetical protein EDD75_0378 [Thermodesulfitimonas autotrophica]